jgi:hypothetical protein
VAKLKVPLLVMNDGSFYEGEFKDGEMNGKGYKFDKNKGTEFIGMFRDGLIHGKGTVRCRNEFTYEG